MPTTSISIISNSWNKGSRMEGANQEILKYTIIFSENASYYHVIYHKHKSEFAS